MTINDADTSPSDPALATRPRSRAARQAAAAAGVGARVVGLVDDRVGVVGRDRRVDEHVAQPSDARHRQLGRSQRQPADEPEVRAALSIYLVNELFTYVDVSDAAAGPLPDQLQVLAGPISAALRQPAIDGVERVLASPQVQEVWSEANRVAHERSSTS